MFFFLSGYMIAPIKEKTVQKAKEILGFFKHLLFTQILLHQICFAFIQWQSTIHTPQPPATIWGKKPKVTTKVMVTTDVSFVNPFSEKVSCIVSCTKPFVKWEVISRKNNWNSKLCSVELKYEHIFFLKSKDWEQVNHQRQNYLFGTTARLQTPTHCKFIGFINKANCLPKQMLNKNGRFHEKSN